MYQLKRPYLQPIQKSMAIHVKNFNLQQMSSMKHLKQLLLCSAVLFCQQLYSQPDSVRRFVDSALYLMKTHAMNRAKVNWAEISSNTKKMAASATTYAQTAPALEYAFNQLEDKHGWLVIDDQEYRNSALQPKQNRLNENMKAAAAKGPHIYAGSIDNKYAYISVPFFGAQDTTRMNRFAQQLQDSLCKYSNKKTKGLILDLRLNAGGNVFPMILGLHNLFPSRTEGAHRITTIGDWKIQDDSIGLSATFYARLLSGCANMSRLPVAVLVGPVTGSSGEFLAIVFTGRKKTTLVGEATAGYTTANQGYLLPGSNNGIVLAESVAVGPDGKLYPDGIVPSILVEGDDFFDHKKDPKIRAAVKWLRKRK